MQKKMLNKGVIEPLFIISKDKKTDAQQLGKS